MPDIQEIRKERLAREIAEWEHRIQTGKQETVFQEIYSSVFGGGTAIRMLREMLNWAKVTIDELLVAVGNSDNSATYWERRHVAVESNWPRAVELAILFHDACEFAAVQEKWQMQEVCHRKSWVDLPEANQRTMIRTCHAVLEGLWKRFGLPGNEPNTAREGICELCRGTEASVESVK